MHLHPPLVKSIQEQHLGIFYLQHIQIHIRLIKSALGTLLILMSFLIWLEMRQRQELTHFHSILDLEILTWSRLFREWQP